MTDRPDLVAALASIPADEGCFCEHDRRVRDDELYLSRSAVLAALSAVEPAPASEPDLVTVLSQNGNRITRVPLSAPASGAALREAARQVLANWNKVGAQSDGYRALRAALVADDLLANSASSSQVSATAPSTALDVERLARAMRAYDTKEPVEQDFDSDAYRREARKLAAEYAVLQPTTGDPEAGRRERYAIGVKASTQRWFVYDKDTGEPVGKTYPNREAAIKACDEANA